MKKYKNLRFRIGEIISCLCVSISISIIVGTIAFDMSVIESMIIGICNSIGLMIISGCLKINNCNINEDNVENDINEDNIFENDIQEKKSDKGYYIDSSSIDMIIDSNNDDNNLNQIDISNKLFESDNEDLDNEIKEFLGTGRH